MPPLVAPKPKNVFCIDGKIGHFLQTHSLPSPCLVVDLDRIYAQYQHFLSCFPQALFCYAVKANPAPEILSLLAREKSCFDVASLPEITAVLEHDVHPRHLSYGNTIKKEEDIEKAYALGIRAFAFDSREELEKIHRVAPESEVFCRILCDCRGADWPLSKKFGCVPEMALWLMKYAAQIGFTKQGIAFHVGSQQGDVLAYDRAIRFVASLAQELATHRVTVSTLNIGGGFPARTTHLVPSLESYATEINRSLRRWFGDACPRIVLEPGRGLVGDAGVLQSEVVLISRKSFDPQEPRWVYLDIGKFGGLIETMDEAIRYPIRTRHDGGPTVPSILAGPTCDSVDTLYEKTPYDLPIALEIGDKVFIESTGAYTTTYASVGFNGFAPLPAHYI